MPDSAHSPIITPRLLIEPLAAEDAPRLQRLFAAAPDWQRALGRAADPDAAAGEIAAAAASPGRAVAALRLREGEQTGGDDDDDVGAVGWWRDRPEPGVALLGMLLVVPSARGRGLAAEALAGLEAHLAGEGMRELRTAFPRRLLALHPLVRALGFAEMSIAEHQLLGLAGAGTSLWKKPLAAR